MASRYWHRLQCGTLIKAERHMYNSSNLRCLTHHLEKAHSSYLFSCDGPLQNNLCDIVDELQETKLRCFDCDDKYSNNNNSSKTCIAHVSTLLGVQGAECDVAVIRQGHQRFWVKGHQRFWVKGQPLRGNCKFLIGTLHKGHHDIDQGALKQSSL